ncbi:V-type ATP synthase subunit H [Methanosphaera cuniculi]|uniref:V-type ATP synthase subunit H n=1 Tax=Methanosphaera cuniculi TaxID=1077256 RepID=A0A2A2HC63_9EURY|nr:V-type ATP synthase subunit H [Methanosphaera cuniculi]PAV06999.1 hypothetical protein ASJ82_01850 [Methanosphaera cuniculi]PWL08563.1 hypothetical protein MSCUN_05420 [Methanosphaera cuniculi]
MANISEAISAIRKAESDADGIIDEANKKSTEMIQQARSTVDSQISKAIEEANDEAKHIVNAREDEAAKEAVIINNESDQDIKKSLMGSEKNVEDAADIIIEIVL